MLPPAVLVIVNPASGRGDLSWRESTIRALSALGRVELVIPSSADATTHCARDACVRGIPLVVAAGGDGTVNRVVGGMQARATRVAILPVGAGNDLAGALGIPLDVTDAAASIVRGATRDLDVLRVNGRRVLTVAVFCAIADAAHLANTLKGRWPSIGSLAYKLAAARMIVTRGGEPVAGVIAANVPRLGGDLRLPSGSIPDDGTCEIATLRGGNRARLARVLLALAADRPLPAGALEWTTFRETTLTFEAAVSASGDGEDLGTACQFRLEVEAAAVRVVVPE